MRFALPSVQSLPAIPAMANGEVVELYVLKGMEPEELRDLLVGLWLKDPLRVAPDCSQVGHLTLPKVVTLVRFSNEISCRGGLVRLTKGNAGVRPLLQDLHCTYPPSAVTRATTRGGLLLGMERSRAH